MSRELDRRSFGTRATPERAAVLHALADADSRAVGHPVQITTFDPATGNPAAVLSADAPAGPGGYVRRAVEHLQSISATLGLTETQRTDFQPDPHVQQTGSGAAAVHLQQTYQGIPIFQANQTVRFAADGRLLETVGQSVTITDHIDAMPHLRVEAAVLAAASYIAQPEPDADAEIDQFGQPLAAPALDLREFTPTVIAAFPDRPDRPTVLAAGPFGDQIKASLLWFDLDGDLRLSWEVILTLPQYSGQYRCLVDAISGEVLYCHQLVHHLAARGNVFRFDGGGQRELLDFPLPLNSYGLPQPADLPPSFPGKWVDAETAEGNLVFAHLDDVGPTVQGSTSDGVVMFDPTLPDGDAQRVLNMFFLNCYIHNYFYLLGFREADGNFQRDNFGQGGLAGDRVDARCYRGAVDGTASMATPIDGASPVMRMGLVVSTNRHTALDSSVVFHEFAHGVTNRLVGGQLNGRALDAIQSQALGEGWSDYFACSVNNTTLIGAWVVNDFVKGIRGAAYDRNYPAQYGNIGSGRFTHIHSIGEIWCAALLELNRNIGTPNGVQLVFDALRLTPANPSLLQARDAIFRTLDAQHQAGQLTPAEYAARRDGVWRAFAKLGMGPAAQSGDARTLLGISADFSVPVGLSLPPTTSPTVRVEASPALAIPDNQPAGVRSQLTVAQVGSISQVAVTVEIRHTYRGDLEIALEAPDGSRVVLQTTSNDARDDIVQTYRSQDLAGLAGLVGSAAQGDWTLHVADLVAEDSGILRRWSLALELMPTGMPAPLSDGQLAADDLKLIDGIGPMIERRLYAAGVQQYAQLASYTPSALAALIDRPGITAERIARQDWPGQAQRRIANTLATPGVPLRDTPTDDELASVADHETGNELAIVEAASEMPERQRYATFTVELLLDAQNEVRRTRVVHVQAGGQEVWAGWEDGRLVKFFVEHAALQAMPPAAHKHHGELLVDVAELVISPLPEASDQLVASVQFTLAGLAAGQATHQQTPYFIHILANQLEGNHTRVLAAQQQELVPGQLEYQHTLEFVAPAVGRYQLLATVVCSQYDGLGVSVGPALRVVP